MPFPINDPRITQPMVRAYDLKGKTGFSLDEIVHPVSIVQDLSGSPYTILPKRIAAFNTAVGVLARFSCLEVRLLSDVNLAEITAVHLNSSSQPLVLSMAGTTDQAAANFIQQAFAVDVAPLGGGTGQDPLTGEISLAAIDLAAGVIGARFLSAEQQEFTLEFPHPIVLRPGGPRLWILGTVANTFIPLCTVFGRLWRARG